MGGAGLLGWHGALLATWRARGAAVHRRHVAPACPPRPPTAWHALPRPYCALTCPPPRSNITIPATFVTKSTGDALKGLLKGGQPVYAVMDWQDLLPRKTQARAARAGHVLGACGAAGTGSSHGRAGGRARQAAAGPGAGRCGSSSVGAATATPTPPTLACAPPLPHPALCALCDAGVVGVLDQLQRPVRPRVRRAEAVHQRVCARGQGGVCCRVVGALAGSCARLRVCRPACTGGKVRWSLATHAPARAQPRRPPARTQEFDSHNWTVFTPHYIVWICPSPYRASSECQSQCIHKGRYCSPDPDGNLTAGYSGSDVVQARRRRRCRCLRLRLCLRLLLRLRLRRLLPGSHSRRSYSPAPLSASYHANRRTCASSACSSWPRTRGGHTSGGPPAGWPAPPRPRRRCLAHAGLLTLPPSSAPARCHLPGGTM